MSENTGIQWCDSTFNPWIGCTKVGPGCDNCYAKADFDDRKHRVTWGPGKARSRTKTWAQPVRWNNAPFYECPDCGARGTAKDMGDEPKDCKHLRAQPARRRVFCASLADVFDNEVDPQWRADLFALIQATPNLDWLLLTKRIGNASEMMQLARRPLVLNHPGAAWPFPPEMCTPLPPLSNVWLGATVVNQEEADRDIPKLLATPARVRFLSMEPLLGPVDLTTIRIPLRGESYEEGNVLVHKDSLNLGRDRPAIDWVIAGGESGPGARPSHPDWYRSLRDQCAAAGVPFLFKQWGEWTGAGGQPNSVPHAWLKYNGQTTPYVVGETYYPPWNTPWKLEDPEDLAFMAKVGKKAAGRLLDGIEHNGFPS